MGITHGSSRSVGIFMPQIVTFDERIRHENYQTYLYTCCHILNGTEMKWMQIGNDIKSASWVSDMEDEHGKKCIFF